MRVIINEEPFIDPSKHWAQRGYWPAKVIAHPEITTDEASVTAYRRYFNLPKDTKIRIHVTADERYELFLDGMRIGRGPERGDRDNWFYETYGLDLKAGEHTLVARTWWLGSDSPAPYAQIMVRPGFVLAAEGIEPEVLNTGVAEWDSKIIGGYSTVSPDGAAWGAGAKVHIKGDEFAWGFETGNGDGWSPAKAICRIAAASYANEYPPIWMLRPAVLPPMMEEPRKVGVARHIQGVDTEDTSPIRVASADNIPAEADSWNRLLKGESTVVIPKNTMRRLIIDLENYYTAYPEFTVSEGKGSKIRIFWAEALYLNIDNRKSGKGNRNEVEGKYFFGMGDTFEPDGGKSRRFDTLWWEAGRYLEVFISTADQPLIIEDFTLRETHFPYDFESKIDASDSKLAEVIPIALRTLEMCSHETYMDCPYYEQLMYVGDTRLEVLTSYTTTRDDRLPKKSLLMFDRSRRLSGLTQSRYPSRVTQVIPPFSLWWVGMVHDFAMWRDDPEFVRSLIPGVRTVLNAFIGYINTDGLVEGPRGWNFTDWVPNWWDGIPPDGHLGVSGILNWQTALILGLAADLENTFGDPEIAQRNLRIRDRIAAIAKEAFWNEDRGIFADDLSKEHYSEHSQCLALLSGTVDGSKRARMIEGLLTDPNLERTTIYFSHYLFETYRLIGRIDKLFERMGLWFGLKDQGFKTTLEMPEPSRSDCHAWGAHPVYHYFASVLGIRPASPGFKTVKIEPQLGHLTYAKGELAHPWGMIKVEFEQKDGGYSSNISLPDGVELVSKV
ncbi:MAG: alpha-L-rhamnosidase C-terminal domain-containing protein [Armatimonadota bacterium]